MRTLLVVVACGLALGARGRARAEGEPTAKEASRHFQRGVDLDNEGDYRGALVEFKKAYALLPRASVLYDIGQTEYQLQDYAAALRTLERFLAETGPGAAHRREVEDAVEVLRGRVGRVAVSVDRADCDVTVDEQPAGTTPLPQPVTVSIGRRHVGVACPGRARVVRDVDVAAADTVRVELALGTPPAASAASIASAPRASDAPRGFARSTVVTTWTITGALGAAALGLYAAAIVESRQLGTLRASYPVTQDQLDGKARAVSRFALAGDVAFAAAALGAGVATYMGMNARPERSLRVGLGWGTVTLGGRF